MVVVGKSAPDTPEGRRGIAMASNLRADLVLIQNAVYAVRNLDFNGPVHVLEEDCRMRGLGDEEIKPGFHRLTYDGLVDLLTGCGPSIGAF